MKIGNFHIQTTGDVGEFVQQVVSDIVTEDRSQIAFALLAAADRLANPGADMSAEQFAEQNPGLTLDQAKAHGDAIRAFAALFAGAVH